MKAIDALPKQTEWMLAAPDGRVWKGPATTQWVFPEVAIDLQPGERYAGAVLDEFGHLMHHLVLMAPRSENKLKWQSACDWAESMGGDLPDRQEQALLYANCKPHLKPEWHWSSETHEDDASFAWGCRFNFGFQSTSRKSYEGAAVLVRRSIPVPPIGAAAMQAQSDCSV